MGQGINIQVDLNFSKFGGWFMNFLFGYNGELEDWNI